MEDPPETGRPPREVIERAVRDILPFALRRDHPREFGFVSSAPTWPGVLADYLAGGFNNNVASWLTASGPSQLRGARHRLVPALVGDARRRREASLRVEDPRRH